MQLLHGWAKKPMKSLGSWCKYDAIWNTHMQVSHVQTHVMFIINVLYCLCHAHEKLQK
jgi:hypothetical protein